MNEKTPKAESKRLEDMAKNQSATGFDMRCALRDASRMITRLTIILDAHRRFHGKVGCPGRPECYVCAEEEWFNDVANLDRATILTSVKMPPPQITVEIAGGPARWTGKHWVSDVKDDQDRIIEWPVTWWRPLEETL